MIRGWVARLPYFQRVLVGASLDKGRQWRMSMGAAWHWRQVDLARAHDFTISCFQFDQHGLACAQTPQTGNPYGTALDQRIFFRGVNDDILQ